MPAPRQSEARANEVASNLRFAEHCAGRKAFVQRFCYPLEAPTTIAANRHDSVGFEDCVGLTYPARTRPRPSVGDIDPGWIRYLDILYDAPRLQFFRNGDLIPGDFGCRGSLIGQIGPFDVDAGTIATRADACRKERRVDVVVEPDAVEP